MIGARAGLVLDDDRLAEALADSLRRGARDEVVRAAGSERHDPFDRLVGPVGRAPRPERARLRTTRVAAAIASSKRWAFIRYLRSVCASWHHAARLTCASDQSSRVSTPVSAPGVPIR